MKKILLFAAVAAVGFSSCSQDEVIDNVNNANAIGFSMYVGQSPIVRGDTDDVPLNGNFGVYAIWKGNAAVDWDSSTDGDENLYDNLSVTSTDGTCSIAESDTKYWSQTNDYYSFLAYAPYSASVSYTNVASASPYISVADNNGTDYLIANTAGQRETNFSTNKVDFAFKHAMSKLYVSLNTTMLGGATVTPKSIVIGEDANGFNTSGELNLVLGNDGTPVWKSVTGGTTAGAKTLTYSAFDSSNKSTSSFLVIPSTAYKLKVSVTYDVTQGGVVYKDCKAAGNVSLSLASATAYNLTVYVSLDEIEFSAAEVIGWTEGTLSGTI